MRILRARFENFRLLRDLELDFSTDPDKRLTVFRAENESGKTTDALGPSSGDYTVTTALPGQETKTGVSGLHPIDWGGH